MWHWGTCISGKCFELRGMNRTQTSDYSNALWLGIDASSWIALCIPSGTAIRANRTWAVRTLRYLAVTGEVDWDAAKTFDDAPYEEAKQIVASELKKFAPVIASVAAITLMVVGFLV
jgi:hypothetical protein